MIVDCAVYVDGERRAGDLPVDHAVDACGDHGFVWIGLFAPTEDEFALVREEFDLHPLAIEDAVHAHQRPKLEKYGDTLFMVLKTLRYDDERESVDVGEVLVFVGESFVISVRHGEPSPLHDVRLALEHKRDLLRCGPGTVLWAIADKVVDDYDPVVAGIDNDIEELERMIFSEEGSDAGATERVYRLKREVIKLQRALGGLSAPFELLARAQFDLIDDDLSSYFRDVGDHVERQGGTADSFRDLLTSALQASLARAAVRQNDDVRRISAWAAIAAVPTAIAGIYGMNFEDMPELTWEFGYPLVLVVIIGLCSYLYWRFRRAGWL
jgi:magnesium transporter